MMGGGVEVWGAIGGCSRVVWAEVAWHKQRNNVARFSLIAVLTIGLTAPRLRMLVETNGGETPHRVGRFSDIGDMMMAKRDLPPEYENKLYEIAAMFEAMAQAECKADYPNTNMIHWFVTEARRAGNLPRQIKMRTGN